MKTLLVILIFICFTMFLVSSVLLDTPWFSDYLNTFEYEHEIRYYLIDAQLFTSITLASFLISHAYYSIKIHGKNLYKEIQSTLGVIIAIRVIFDFLDSYQTAVMIEKMLMMMNTSQTVKAKNSITDAYNMYYNQGIAIEYFECNTTKKIYKPSSKHIRLREEKIFTSNRKDRIPLYIVISFIILITSFYYTYSLTNRELHSKNNKSKEGT